MRKFSFCLLGLAAIIGQGNVFVESDDVQYAPNSCAELEDGIHWLQLIDDNSYPLVQVKCSNGFAILDVNLDSNLKEYFSSWDMWHYAIAGPRNDDPVNWANWYVPGAMDADTKYLVSDTCQSCEIADSEDNGNELANSNPVTASDDSAYANGYYMTGNMFGCFWYIRGLHDCDMDWETYECFFCDCDGNGCDAVSQEEYDEMSDTDGIIFTGTCATLEKSVTTEVATTHDDCTSAQSPVNFKPSIGTDGRNCVCVQPSKVGYFEGGSRKIEEKKENEQGSTDDVYYLYQKDFVEGTYRITKSGTYVIMEDITFDFNAGTSNEDGAWLPHLDQIDEYPGAAQYRDPYFMGFFAGITVETENVIIDLNGKILKQSKAFYYQQRWFSHIELANQPFMPAQGPGMFGDTVSSASNLEIKNGIFGLTSHHAIHGNRCSNIKIHDIEIKDFETHGIQINGFDNIELYNIDIHSSSQIAYLKGEYGHARMLLPRLRNIYEEDPTQRITFSGKRGGEVSMKDIFGEIENEINLAFDYVMNDLDSTKMARNFDEHGELWQNTKKNFLYLRDEDDDLSSDAVHSNSGGLPYGTAVYGIFLSFPGANVFSYGSSNLKSSNAVLSNIKIHGVRHKMHEYLRLHQDIPFDVNPFNAVFDANAAMSNVGDFDTSEYYGNIMTDAYVAMNKFTDNWGYLQMQNLYASALVDFATGDTKLEADFNTLSCNADVMTHSGKGTIGIRLDGIDNAELNNIEIYDMYDYTKLGSELCGEYDWGFHNGGGHFLQKMPMQTGFSGNMVQGISIVNSDATLSDINVHDIGSATGLTYGIALWKDCEIELSGDIASSNIMAGFQLDIDSFDYDSRPNKAPEACGILAYWDFEGDETSVTKKEDGKELNIMSECVTGHVGCLNTDSFGGATLGSYVSCNDAFGTNNGMIRQEYLTDVDKKLLGLKDMSQDLHDFASRETLSFEQSRTIFNDEDSPGSLRVKKHMIIADNVMENAYVSEEFVPNSCNDLEDGVYMMKFIDSDDYPAVKMKCSNGFAILDYSFDEQIAVYFDTFSQWFPNTGGPLNDIHPTWQEWFLANKVNTKYVISPDCNSCEVEHKRQLYGDSTTYWMTGNIFGCFWDVRGLHNCDYDYDSGECYTCQMYNGKMDGIFSIVDDDTTAEHYDSTGICPFNIRSKDYYTPQTHDACARSEKTDTPSYMHLKPSLGLNGEHCVCFQQEKTNYFLAQVDKDAITNEVGNENKNEEINEEDDNENDVIHYLYQTHFISGTYRITKSGTYKIMEDIVFDFNKNEEDPNGKDAYVPRADQSTYYPGAGNYKDAYFMGFFAGITVEAEDVVVDLNGHRLEMSEYFYYQQRWFTIIELSTQYFLPGQGIGNFGGDPSVASNVEIRDGILGLTSHHAIHGNHNRQVLLKNIKVENWETHGIQLNGFDGVKMIDIEIGKTSDKVYFSGEYGHMRMLLPRYKKIADEMESDLASGAIDESEMYIHFDGRDEATTMRDITDEIELEMNLAFDYVTKGVSITDENDEYYDSFVSALNLFVRDNSIPYGGAQYGIFLNTFGASVFTYNLETNYYSSNVYMENIKIHGLRHSMKEYVMFEDGSSQNVMLNPFNAPISAEETFVSMKIEGDEKFEYRGNLLVDAYIASNKFSNSFNYLQLQLLGNDLVVPWATGETELGSDAFTMSCAVDVMIHTGKGINGLRLDGVESVVMKNIEIYDIHDSTPLGKDICGRYQTQFRQTLPMQKGFSGNMNQAININAAKNVIIEDVRIHDIVSDYGPAFGISIWPACEVTLQGDIIVNDLNAGKLLESGTFSYTDLPNQAPEACAVRIYDEYTLSSETYTTIFHDDDANYKIGKESLIGHVGCFGDDDIYEHVKYTQMSSDSKSNSRQANTIDSKIVGNDNIHVIAIFVAICLISLLYCFVCRRKNKQDEVNFSMLENESDRFLDSKNENYGTYL